MENNMKVFKITINKKSKLVRASGIKQLSDWAKLNNVSNWSMIGMQSRQEIKNNELLEIVA
jgi:hypothetical protein